MPETSPGVTSVPGTHHRFVDVGEVRLHVVEAGSGPLVVLLHGFPEFWWSWRHQLVALAAAGFRAVAPDLRGYNLSDRPRGVAAYALPRLAADVSGLIAALGEERASVAGHDWGGAVAWELASRYPQRLQRLAILNSPHPEVLRRALRKPGQLLRSSYMLAFQAPALPERLLMAADGALLRRALRALRTSRPDRAELDAYVAAARRGGSLRGGLDYYRAALRSRALAPTDPPRTSAPLEVPVLVIWGERDPALQPELATPPASVAPGATVVMIPGASHGVQLDAPDEVSRLLVDFMSGEGAPRDPREPRRRR
jgi:pimeloyl-ACP methyl ester carboxylesterase